MRTAARWAVWAAICVVFAFPLLVMITGAFRPVGLLTPGAQLVPSEVSGEALSRAFEYVPLARSLLNSALLAAFYVPLCVITASWAGLAIARAGRRFRRLAIVALLALMVVPPAALWITRFVLFESLGLVGTYGPLLAPALAGGSPLYVLLYTVAIRRIPSELFEAAQLERVGALHLWARVALPLTRPTTAAVALLAFVASWSNFVDPLLYLRTESSLTAPAMLRSLELMGPTNWPVLLAGALVVTIPVVLIFVVMQRFFLGEDRGLGWLGR